MPRLVRSVALYEGSRLSAGLLGLGVRREATGVAKVRVETLEEIEVLGDCRERGVVYGSRGDQKTDIKGCD